MYTFLLYKKIFIRQPFYKNKTLANGIFIPSARVFISIIIYTLINYTNYPNCFANLLSIIIDYQKFFDLSQKIILNSKL